MAIHSADLPNDLGLELWSALVGRRTMEFAEEWEPAAKDPCEATDGMLVFKPGRIGLLEH